MVQSLAWKTKINHQNKHTSLNGSEFNLNFSFIPPQIPRYALRDAENHRALRFHVFETRKKSTFWTNHSSILLIDELYLIELID